MPERENDALAYGVNIEPVEVPVGEAFWKAVRVHHLTPEENHGNHHIFIDVLDEEGQRIYGAQVKVTWPGGEQVLTVDKPPNEPGTNFPVWRGQVCSVEALGLPSDKVTGIHTGHPDEGPGNTLFHHSFLVVFQRTVKTGEEEEPIQSVIQGTVEGGAGETIVLLKDGNPVSSQVIGPDESFRFANLPAGTYSLEVSGTDLKVADIQVDGRQVITLSLTLKKEEEEKAISHYVLFGPPGMAEVSADIILAMDYLLHFSLTWGFSVEEALKARYVTIIGDLSRVSAEDEARLENAGCKVQRIQGDSYAVQQALNQLIKANRPFQE